ncbi:NfeD family protein [Kangiella geojedonensis]|uniref:Serine protease n=1 Tax=Kangiella geojedonensis TaxID=914150 RepID=A0A0F6TSA9_9GAMM|nr:nodulation protein NfeD [Kangiella geojedonensis]AKE53074.1 serine protease [Kangiella geojedonensis]
MQHIVRTFFYIALLVFAWPAISATENEEISTPQAKLLKLDGSVNPGTAHYLVSNVQSASEENYDLIIIQMNTPGGLDLAMRDIIREILSSDIPVATYVYPPGSRAASAGTYILYASHVSSMAPATNLGAATPVSIGGMPDPPSSDKKDDKAKGADNEQSQPTSSNKNAMHKKIINDAEAYLRGLAAYHGRNIDWVKNAVREGESLTSKEAFEIGVIDVIADSPRQLLQQIDQRSVRLPSGQAQLDTSDMSIVSVEPTWQMQLLSIITDPNIAYILLLIGVYGLIFEGYNPGTFVPGVIGAICLLLAFYALQILPINYVAAGLLVLGIALLVVEAFAPSFGILGVGGIIAFLFGSFMLFNEPDTGIAVATPILLSVTVITVILLSFVLSLAIRSKQQAVVSGREELLSEVGVVKQDFNGEGWVHICGESWKAHCEQPLTAGQQVKVIAVNDLELTVVPLTDDSA